MRSTWARQSQRAFVLAGGERLLLVGLPFGKLRLGGGRRQIGSIRHVDGQRLAIPTARGGDSIVGQRAVVPGADGGAGDNGAGVFEAACRAAGAVREPTGRGVAQLAAIAIGDRRVADETVPRAELSAGARRNRHARAGDRLDDVARRADVVGTDQRVVPGERRRVAGVVDDRGHDASGGVGSPSHDQRVVGRVGRIEAADEQTVVGVPKIAIGRQRAAAAAVDDRDGLQRGRGLGDGVGELPGEALEIRRDQLTAGQIRGIGGSISPAAWVCEKVTWMRSSGMLVVCATAVRSASISGVQKRQWSMPTRS